MDVFLMVKGEKVTIFTDCKCNTSVLELKRKIEGILKVPPADQKLFNKARCFMQDDKTLQEYGLTYEVAKAECPATVKLVVRTEAEKRE